MAGIHGRVNIPSVPLFIPEPQLEGERDVTDISSVHERVRTRGTKLRGSCNTRATASRWIGVEKQGKGIRGREKGELCDDKAEDRGNGDGKEKPWGEINRQAERGNDGIVGIEQRQRGRVRNLKGQIYSGTSGCLLGLAKI